MYMCKLTMLFVHSSYFVKGFNRNRRDHRNCSQQSPQLQPRSPHRRVCIRSASSFRAFSFNCASAPPFGDNTKEFATGLQSSAPVLQCLHFCKQGGGELTRCIHSFIPTFFNKPTPNQRCALSRFRSQPGP